jgi:uncharacterized repeat protein (TIGR01451 family)
VRPLAAGALAVAMLLASPRGGGAATADGVMITNSASLTAYWGSSGLSYGMRYTISFNVTVMTIVATPSTVVQKTVSPAIANAGETLTYTIWFVNTSPFGSAFNIIANDPLPANVNYDAWRGMWNGGTGGTWFNQYSADNVVFFSGNPAQGQAAPCYLRFTMNMLGPKASAFTSYSVTIQ